MSRHRRCPAPRPAWRGLAALLAGLALLPAASAGAASPAAASAQAALADPLPASLPRPVAANLPTAVPANLPAPVTADLPTPVPGFADAVSRTPAYRAALRLVEAEQAQHRQLQLGPQEWVGSLSSTRRVQRSPVDERQMEWELGLDRTLRLPGKAAVADQLGRVRVAQAEAAARSVWREQAGALLERQADWLRERGAARVWQQQRALLQRQHDQVVRRQRLGDAARIELLQAGAALTQAEAQAGASGARAAAAAAALRQRFPELAAALEADLLAETGFTGGPALPVTPGTPRGVDGPAAAAGMADAVPDVPRVTAGAAGPAGPADGADGATLDQLLGADPALDAARRASALARAQLDLDSAETRPDPTLGLRIGRARSGAEQVVGVVLSLPFGGEHRAAGVSATAARLAAALDQQDQALREAGAAAAQRLQAARSAAELWQRSAAAARQLRQVAGALERGYALGEGSLSDLLGAHRLANEQDLLVAASAADAWVSRWQLRLAAGQLGPAPAGSARP